MRIEIFKDIDGKWRIRLRRKGRKIMTSEAYSSKAKARQTARSVSKLTGWNIFQ